MARSAATTWETAREKPTFSANTSTLILPHVSAQGRGLSSALTWRHGRVVQGGVVRCRGCVAAAAGPSGFNLLGAAAARGGGGEQEKGKEGEGG